MLLVVVSRSRDVIYKVNQKDLMDFKYIEDLKVSFGYRGLIPGLTVSSIISTNRFGMTWNVVTERSLKVMLSVQKVTNT